MDRYGLDKQADIEDLSAWMDGELSAPDARRVAGLVRTDAGWRAAYEQFQAVDEALEGVSAPRAGRPLADEIVRAAHRRRLVRRVIRFAAPVAAAAAVLLAVWLARQPAGPQPVQPQERLTSIEKQFAGNLPGVPPQEWFLVLKLPMFENLPEIETYQQVRDVADEATLAALAGLEEDKDM